MLYADAAYTDYALEELWRESEQVRLTVARKKNSKRPHGPWQTYLLLHLRKGVETTISQITERFPKSIHAVTAEGFALKLLLFIFTHTLAELGAYSDFYGSNKGRRIIFVIIFVLLDAGKNEMDELAAHVVAYEHFVFAFGYFSLVVSFERGAKRTTVGAARCSRGLTCLLA